MRHHRNIYLNMKPLEEARQLLFSTFSGYRPLSSQRIPVPDAVGRVLAEPVAAVLSSPQFHLAAMDGVAVAAEATFGAGPAAPKQFTVGQDAFYVNTGHVMPPHTNAVIMIEYIQEPEEGRIEIEAPAFPWQHVRRVGEDIVATEQLFPRHHLVTPYCIGALLSAGVGEVGVLKKPLVLLIPTGAELTAYRSAMSGGLKPGQVIESNSYVLGKLVESWGGTYSRHAPVGDDLDEIKRVVGRAVESDVDLILISGGSSAGSEDFARSAIEGLGRILVHGVTIMPGKPLIIGEVGAKPVFGIPGYPVSAVIAFEQFVGPLLSQLLGQPEKQRERISVEPTRKIASRLGIEEFVRVKLGKVGDRIVATPLGRGAGAITTLTRADGLIRIPGNVEGLPEFTPVQAELLRPLTAIEQTLVVVGSHDNTLDVLADRIRADYPDMTLSSSHVGSMGGLMAIRKGACHAAGSHLLDTEDGTYNRSYIRKYLPDQPVMLVNLVMRDQGLMVAKGNPKRIQGIQDLVRGDVTFINRQGGSGTRILLDYRLRQLGIEPSSINGYQSEEFTHMAVAVAVLSGAVDTGLGIFAAARALDLDFIPVVTEQYDLIIPELYAETEGIQRLLRIVRTDDFQNRVRSLGGYSTVKTGEVLTV
ncbi:MAG: molybdopterin biosynthesis protein [Thermodesulfobacteriota bacterium]